MMRKGDLENFALTGKVHVCRREEKQRKEKGTLVWMSSLKEWLEEAGVKEVKRTGGRIA